MATPPTLDREARWAPWALAAITLAAALLRFPSRTAEDLWFDEVFSVVLASQDLPELLRRAIADQTNPPGFYLLLWGWARLGSFDPGWLRALPALAGTAVVPAVALLGRELRMGWGNVLLASLLAAVSPLLLAMSVEVRAYAPLALMTVVTLTFAVRVAQPSEPTAPGGQRGRRVWAALALAQVALVSLHYFGALVVAGGVMATWWTHRARARAAFNAALPAALVLAGWMALVIANASGPRVGGNATWIEAPGIGALRSYASHAIGTFGTAWGAAAISALLLAAIAVAARRAARVADPRARWLLVTALFPLALVFLASLVAPRSLWVARYLIIALPPLWLLVADAAFALPVRARATGIAALVAWAALAGPLAERARVQKPAWSLLARAMAGAAPATLCVNESFLGLTLQYHAVKERLPLRVLDFADCAARRAGSFALLRPSTTVSLERLARGGATVGPARAFPTALPDTELHTLRWSAP